MKEQIIKHKNKACIVLNIWKETSEYHHCRGMSDEYKNSIVFVYKVLVFNSFKFIAVYKKNDQIFDTNDCLSCVDERWLEESFSWKKLK